MRARDFIIEDDDINYVKDILGDKLKLIKILKNDIFDNIYEKS